MANKKSPINVFHSFFTRAGEIAQNLVLQFEYQLPNEHDLLISNQLSQPLKESPQKRNIFLTHKYRRNMGEING